LFKHTDGTPGLDLSKWGPYPKRRLSKVKAFAKKWASCTTAAERKRIEEEGGVRDSELYRLPYWTPLRQACYDPFHVVLLGICKRMVEVWADKEYLGIEQFGRMQKLVDAITLPPGFADLGNNIGSGFSYMTGARWLTWCLIASPYALYKMIPDRDYTNWMRFVEGCRLIFRPSITLDDADEAHKLFVAFYEENVKLYGASGVSPNQHFLLHTYDNIFDLGSIYSYWLFPFERYVVFIQCIFQFTNLLPYFPYVSLHYHLYLRYNKLVKNININCKDSFEVTMLKTFLKRKNAGPFVDMMADADKNEVNLTENHAEFLKSVAGYTRELGARAHNVSQKVMSDLYKLSSIDYPYEVTGSEYIPLYEKMEGKTVFMKSDHYQLLLQFYETIAYKDSFPSLSFEATPEIRIRSKLEIGGELYTSTRSATPSGSFISAFFIQSSHSNKASFPGVIEYFFEHYPIIDGVETRHVFAFTRWFKNLGNSNQPYIDSGLEFWDVDFEALDPLAILPVQKICSYVGIVKYVPDAGRGRPNSRVKMLVFPTHKKLRL
jgi:hypothetical protein